MSTPADPRDALVASPHWEWRRGMIDADGLVCLGKISVAVHRWQPDGNHLLWADPQDGGLTWSPLRPNERDERDAAPTYLDINNHANHGHLLALVCKAWGHCRIEITVWEDGSATVYLRDASSGDLLHDAAGDTLGLALAAALLAAPAKASEPTASSEPTPKAD